MAAPYQDRKHRKPPAPVTDNSALGLGRVPSFHIHHGLSEQHRKAAAALYWQAFGSKLGRVLGRDARAMGYVASVLRPDHAIAAVGIDGHLIGVAGFRSRQGAFVFGALADLRAYYGWAGALRRAFLLSLIHNDIDNHRFLVDGIAVDEASRGQGVGTSLIEALCDRARASGYAEIRLDVVGWNIRARSLYERRGFIARGSARSSLTSLLFGFSRAITMTRTL